MQSTKSSDQRLAFIISIFLLHFSISSVFSLQCHSDDGPSDGELKDITRRCMRKVGGNSYMPRHNDDNTSNDKGAFNARRQQQQQQRPQQHQQQRQQSYGQQSQSRNNNYNNDDDSVDDYVDDNSNGYNGYMPNNNNNNKNKRNSHKDNSDRNSNIENHYISDAWGQRNRERMESQQRLKSSSASSASSNNARNSKVQRNGDNASGVNNQNNYQNNNNNFNRNNDNNNNNNNNNSDNNNNSSIDSACIVHCFFDEMNMLNQDSYPDRHKVIYILTKNLRDRELRSFYIETIEECFYYLEPQRRLTNQCQYSRNLINCMTEYARINCDDWDNHSLIFN